MKNKANTIEAARTAISAGFTTKVEKKAAKDILDRAWGVVRSQALEAGMPRDTVTWDLPRDGAHQVGPKAFRLLASYPAALEAAQLVRTVYLELKATEVVKKAAKVDDTKVRDLGPQAATTLGIDFIDMKGDRRGYCYCCGRIGFMLNDAGRLSRHGYTRPGWGYDTAACHGTRKTPEQTLDIAILWNKSMIQDLEGMLETDLVAFSLKQARRQIKANRVDSYGGRRNERKGSYNRDANARGLRALRAGQEPQSLSGPKVWRRMLTTQLEQHRNELASLEAVKAAI
tara:strand:- start:56058 stop:56915 length:858 start_codon:yes stop_codon:yes gene_type:complete